MDRREFSKIALGGALGSAYAQSTASYEGLGRPPMKWGIKHSMQAPSLTDEDLILAKQLGMEWVNTWSTPDKYQDIVRRVESFGLKVAKIGNGRVHNNAAIVLGLPGRDEKIEEFKQNLRALAAAGIRYQLYAHMANGVWSTERETARGGASCRAFDASKKPFSGGSSHNNVYFERKYTDDELWANWEYFVRRIAPVAEETGVKIGVHCDDPPGLTLGNLQRPIFSSFEGYKRALEIANSPNIGMGLCVGCWLEGGPAMGRNVLETIDYFGGLKKLFIVHFRNVSSPLPHFRETFLNEGYMDMYIMKRLRQVNFDGVLIADHWPATIGGDRIAHAYTLGYIQALIERANEEFLV
ncbi:MAG TPA: mannonate dehydratase [Bryobacteraceae bacterium]|nr:mannonate dehydratase [Bryobacteraceae bacterium]HOL70378.1 mannonate dehydratase [Bryobacteraceae bacterium]HOQ46568.1 mannonate dehydratase [Bryobacteraceae bacterium]HPU73359.1 mannonate dehydratase [Bryobacteraceae bacterium]